MLLTLIFLTLWDTTMKLTFVFSYLHVLTTVGKLFLAHTTGQIAKMSGIFFKATICRYWHFCAIWRLPQFLSASPLRSIQIQALVQLVRCNVGAQYKQNSLHHNSVMWWNLYVEVNMYATCDSTLSLKLHSAETSDCGGRVAETETPFTLIQDQNDCSAVI